MNTFLWVAQGTYPVRSSTSGPRWEAGGLLGAGRQRKPRRLKPRCSTSRASFKRLTIADRITIGVSVASSTSIESGGRVCLINGVNAVA
jgi:hypothetical protein